MEYFPEDTMIYIDNPEKVARQATVYSMEFATSMEGRLEGGYVLPGQANVLYDGKMIVGKLALRRLVLMSELHGERKKR